MSQSDSFAESFQGPALLYRSLQNRATYLPRNLSYRHQNRIKRQRRDLGTTSINSRFLSIYLQDLDEFPQHSFLCASLVWDDNAKNSNDDSDLTLLDNLKLIHVSDSSDELCFSLEKLPLSSSNGQLFLAFQVYQIGNEIEKLEWTSKISPLSHLPRNMDCQNYTTRNALKLSIPLSEGKLSELIGPPTCMQLAALPHPFKNSTSTPTSVIVNFPLSVASLNNEISSLLPFDLASTPNLNTIVTSNLEHHTDDQKQIKTQIISIKLESKLSLKQPFSNNLKITSSIMSSSSSSSSSSSGQVDSVGPHKNLHIFHLVSLNSQSDDDDDDANLSEPMIKLEKRYGPYCPFCSMFCGCSKGLMLHLTASHDLFDYSDGVDEFGARHITIRRSHHSTLGKDIISPEECFYFSTKLNLPSQTTKILSQESSSSSISSSSLLATKEVLPVRQYYHSRTGAPMAPHEMAFDSDDEMDEEWCTEISERLIDDFEDVSVQEKLFFKLWNRHVKHPKVFSDAQMPETCHHFATLQGPILNAYQLRYNFMLHLLNLWDNSLLAAHHVSHCLAVVDGFAHAAVQPKSPSNAK